MILRLSIVGRVQGVGYRDWAVRAARRFDLSGWVRNRMDGSVEAVVSGDDATVADFIAKARVGPPAARVDRIDQKPAENETTLPYPFDRRPTA
ncbi:acylphosphatase [Sphingobium aquiterrae]|uniref:acylphosphatase n=1 Tax=Sphingobium aquiterrae TaxID=2038656 RepID=UPI003018EAB5